MLGQQKMIREEEWHAHGMRMWAALIDEGEDGFIRFVMKSVAKMEMFETADMQWLDVRPIYEKLIWWKRILKFLRLYKQKISYEEGIKTTRYELPAETLESILWQRRFWAEKGFEPTKVLVSREVFDLIRRDATALDFSMAVGGVFKIYGLEIVVHPFLDAKMALVC